MALAKQNEETKKKTTNTTKQSNKEAIQNINRTGTVSGQASGVKNISAPIPKTSTDASNLAGVKYQTSNKTVNTGSKPTGVNTQSYNLAGSNNIKSAVGTPTKNQNTLKSNAYTTNTSNQRVGAETVERNQRKYQTTLSGLADNSTRTAHDILNTAGNYWNSAKQAVSNAVQENKLRASNTTAGLAYQRLEKQRADSIAHDEKERQETFKTISENDVNNFFDKDGNEIDFQKNVSDLETQLAGYDDLLAQELDDSQRMLYENQKLKTEQDLEYNREMLKKSRAYFETANLEYFKGDRDTYNSLRETYSHKDDSLAERFGTATAHLVASTINDIPTAMDQIKLAGQANVANDYIEQLKGLYETGQISDEAYAEGLRYWNDAIESYKQEYNDSFSQVMRAEVDQLSSNTHYGADQIQEFALNAGESTAQFLLHFAIGKGIAGLANLKNAEATAQLLNEIGGNIATTTMSISSATSKMNQLLDEGYSHDVAMKNGFLTGLISFVIEKTGSVDRFIDMLGTPVSVSTMGEVLLGVGKSGLSEGLEETVEDLLTPVVDFYTAGKDVEVNGNELLMSFLLGGTSGVLMAVSGNVVGTAQNVLNQRTAINELLRTNKALRAEVLNNIKQTSGNFVVNTRAQYNLLKSQIEQLNSYKGSMSPEQDLITEALTDKVYSALSDYENRSQVMGVTLTEDIVETPSEQEKEHVIYETLESDFNQEVKTNEEIEALQQKINEGLEELAVNDLATTEAIQQSLTEHGYDIDAELFQSLDEAKQNEVLVALDASKIKGINVNMMDDAGIRQFLLDNDHKLQKYAYNHTPEQVEAKINRIVSGTKGIRFGDQILINVNRSNAILSTFVHEITHGTENSALYDPLKEAVKNIYENWDDTVEKKAKVYDEIQSFDDPNKRFDNAEREVVAETVENNLGDEEFLDNLIRYDFSLVSRMYQNLKAFGSNDTVVKLQNAFEKAFRKYESQYRYSFSFDAKGNLVDNTGAPINKKMAERINGTKLTDAEGNPYRLYHTSEAFFNTLDPRGTDHYKFGDKVVNYFSNNEIVSGSYTGDEYRQITGEDSYNEYEADVLSEQVLRDLIKEKDQEYRDSYEKLQNQMREAVRNENVQNAVRNIEKNINSTDIFNTNSDPVLLGLGSGYNASLLSSIEYDINNIKSSGATDPFSKISSLIQLYELRNGGKYFDAKPISEVRDLLAPIDNVSIRPLAELRDQYRTETTKLLNELDELRENRENLEKDLSKGKQYVGYGKATNPFVLENNSGETVSWNDINALDYRMPNEDFALVENEILRASRNLGPEDFENLRKKPGVNKWILNSISDEARDALAKNPVMLANFASSLRDIFAYVDRNLKHPDLEFLKQEYPEAYKEEVRSIIDGVEKLVKNKLKTGREYNSQGTKYSDLNTLETNDVVGAILSLNEFAGTSYDSVVFKNIADSASYKARGILSDIIALFEPNQFKLLENENPTDNPDFRYSYNPDENVGYHYGAENLDYNKKSERLSSRSGRGTGAFGTGTYFFGDGRFKSSYMTDKGKTEHKVDFSNYNLFRPKTTEEGYALHDALKSFDDAYRYVDTNSISEYLNGLEEVRDDMLAFVGEEEDDPNRPQINADDLDPDSPDFWVQYEKRVKEFERAYDEYEANRDVPDYDKLSPEDDEYSFFVNRLIEAGMDEDEAQDLFNRNADENGDVDLRSVAGELVHYYLDYNDLDVDSDIPESIRGRIKLQSAQNKIEELAKSFGVKPYKLSYIVKNAMLDSLAESTRPDFDEAMYDSVGTKVMKALGYEGIDVRNMEGLDNATYGSVIYDLKPESVQYAYEPDNGIINEEENDELKRIQEPSSALSEEQLALLKSRDKSFIKGVRNDITALFRRRYESSGDSNNDSKRIITVSGDDFYEFFKANRNYLRDPETVTLHDKADYQNGTAYMSNDGLSGFYIAEDGDLQSVYNNSGKPGFPLDISDIVKERADSLDCFESDVNHLARMYQEAFGFKVASILDFNREVMEDEHGKEFTDSFIKKFGEAPVYFMVKTDQDVETKHFAKDQWQEAYDYRNSFIERKSDLEITDEDLKNYRVIDSATTEKYGKKNIDKETGILKPKAIIELDTTIGKTTHEEEIQDGEEYAGKFVEALDNGADVDDLLQRLMDHPLENGLVRAYYVSQALADRGMESEYMELAQWARDIDNLGGKLIESTKILYNLDSTFSKAVYLTQVEENLKSEYKERLKNKKGVDVEQTISEIFNEYANKIINSKTSREFRSAIGALTREVNRRMPKTIWDRIHQYRMLAMLSGTKTAVSNFVSNTFSLGLYKMNSMNQALLESAMQNVEIKSFDDKKTYQIKQEDRNATLRKDPTATKRNRKLATEIWDSLGENEKTKYGIETEKIPDIIKNNLKIKNETTQSKLSKAVGGLFDAVQNVQGVLLNDAPFAKVAFVQRFDELARARGINTDKINKSSKEYARLIDDAYNYAQEVVSHNDTDISKTIANLTRRSASNVRINEDSTLVGLDKQIKRFKERANNGEPIYRFIDSAVSNLQKWFVPFYKTNASLLQKSLQYSPLEWGQVINDWGKVKAGRMEVVDMVEHMSKAVTGTELYLVGAIFGFLGLLKWEKDDEDYSGRLSIKIPGTDKGYTVDFIDPISTIFAKGVVLAQNISEQGGPFKTIEGLVRDYEDIFLSDELDMFSSMKDFFDTVGKVRKGKDDYGEYTLGDGATDIAFSVLNSYIPSIVRDVSRMIDPAKKNVYDTDNKKYLFNRLVNSTPFRTSLVDKKDATGRTINYTQPFTGNDVFDRILTQMVSRGKLVDSNGQAITTRSGSQNMQATSSDGYTQMAKDFQYKDENGDGFSDAHWIRDSVPSNIYPAGVKTELTPKEKETYGKTWTDTWTSGANYLADNDIYKGLSYENQADVVYELQGFARECIEADYCMANNLEMTEAQRTANEIRNFCTVNGKLDGKMLGLIALGTAKENKLASGGQRYVMAEQDEEGKTIRNSRQLAMRHIYEEAGIYDKIVEAVQNSDGALTYADFGLGKTVVEKYSDEKAGSDYQTIYNKTMKSSSKKSSKVSGGSAGGITKANGGGSTKKLSMAPNPIKETKVANSYLKAYADVFKRNSSKATSSSGGTVICPKCGNRVYAGAKRCPVCGTSL